MARNAKRVSERATKDSSGLPLVCTFTSSLSPSRRMVTMVPDRHVLVLAHIAVQDGRGQHDRRAAWRPALSHLLIRHHGPAWG